MAREKFSTLTEQMFYILLCLREECCGMDVMARVNDLTGGAAWPVGPGTGSTTCSSSFWRRGYMRSRRARRGGGAAISSQRRVKRCCKTRWSACKHRCGTTRSYLRDNAPCGRREMRESEG